MENSSEEDKLNRGVVEPLGATATEEETREIQKILKDLAYGRDFGSGTPYPRETLGDDEDDGTMEGSREHLEKAVVGHKILDSRYGNLVGRGNGLALLLDNEVIVWVAETSDCCAYTCIPHGKILTNIHLVDHIITGVGTTDGYTTWHIYCDLGDVLKMNVDWSPGNPFYYGYGFEVTIIPLDKGDFEAIRPPNRMIQE